MPVLPLAASTMQPPLLRTPPCTAFLRMCTAIRSLIELRYALRPPVALEGKYPNLLTLVRVGTHDDIRRYSRQL